MKSPSIIVTAGSRLHFGMFAFGQPETRQFGGVGAMIDVPLVIVRLQRSRQWNARGPMAERALDTARYVVRAWGGAADCAASIEVLTAPRQHVGLGSGTQLALAIAQGLHALFEQGELDAQQLARRAGRGRRSAIGLYGFLQGGLLMEAGKRQADEISPLVARVELPDRWRWVLACPHDREGLSGADEQAAFERLPPVPREISQQLRSEAEQNLFPAARAADFTPFSRSLYRFGQLAGGCFKTQQAGTFATIETAALAQQIRGLGIEGVGQSSWGPLLFALTESEDAAHRLVAELREQSTSALEFTIARPLNTGATLNVAE